MNKKHALAGLVILATATLLAGCDGALATPEATVLPVVADASSGTVVAEAVIEPARTEELSFEMGGKVVEVHVDDARAVIEDDGAGKTLRLKRTGDDNIRVAARLLQDCSYGGGDGSQAPLPFLEFPPQDRNRIFSVSVDNCGVDTDQPHAIDPDHNRTCANTRKRNGSFLRMFYCLCERPLTTIEWPFIGKSSPCSTNTHKKTKNQYP